MEAIIENMSDALVIFDKKGGYKKFNKACRDIFMFNIEKTKSIEEVYRQAEFIDMDGNRISVEDSPVKKVLNGEKFLGFKEMVKINDSIFSTELNGTPIYDKSGNFVAGILLISDVTDKVKLQENILVKTQLDLLNNIIENLQVGVIRCSYPDFKIIDINNIGYEYLQQTNSKTDFLSSVISQNYFDTFDDMEEVELTKALHGLSGQKDTSYFNYIKYYVIGKETYLKVIYQPLFGLSKQITELVVIAIDISEEVKAKNNMAEVLKLQEELFTNVAHELKTPLNLIFSTDQLIEYYLENNLLEVNKEKIRKGIDVIKQNCYRLTKLINNIVDLSKIESGFLKLNLSNENIVQIAEDIVQSISDYVKRRKLNIIFDTNTEDKTIACDCDKIERVILNLISNVIKFTNTDGSIYINIFDKGDIVEISVKDTGIGIDKKNQENIFERFRQVDKSLSRNTEGSGIGLSLVKSIVEMHKGKISVESEAGKGSTFTVELPARIVESSNDIKKSNLMKNKIEMINVEFSDIYSI